MILDSNFEQFVVYIVGSSYNKYEYPGVHIYIFSEELEKTEELREEKERA